MWLLLLGGGESGELLLGRGSESLFRSAGQGRRCDRLIQILAAVLIRLDGFAAKGRLLAPIATGPVDNVDIVPVLLSEVGERALVVIVVVVAVGAVSFHGGRDDNALGEVALRLEAHGVGAVLNDLDLAVHVDVAVLALDGAVGEAGLQFECAVGRLVAVGVGSVLVVLVDLLENWDWGGSLSLLCSGGR